MQLRWWCLVLGACTGRSDPIQPTLDGSWDVSFTVAEVEQPRLGAAHWRWNDELQVLDGEISMEEPDGTRVFDVLGGEDIGGLGVALQLAERTGVRLLFAEVAPPLDGGTFGSWRTRWGCSRRVPDGCGEDGTMTLMRAEGEMR